MISRTVVLLAVVGVTCAATWAGYLPPKPREHAHKTGCYVQEINDVIPFGESVSPIGYCYRIDCGSQMMYYASCGKVGAGPGCFVTKQDLTKPYPQCCPDVKCTEDNQINKDNLV